MTIHEILILVTVSFSILLVVIGIIGALKHKRGKVTASSIASGQIRVTETIGGLLAFLLVILEVILKTYYQQERLSGFFLTMAISTLVTVFIIIIAINLCRTRSK